MKVGSACTLVHEKLAADKNFELTPEIAQLLAGKKLVELTVKCNKVFVCIYFIIIEYYASFFYLYVQI